MEDEIEMYLSESVQCITFIQTHTQMGVGFATRIGKCTVWDSEH